MRVSDWLHMQNIVDTRISNWLCHWAPAADD